MLPTFAMGLWAFGISKNKKPIVCLSPGIWYLVFIGFCIWSNSTEDSLVSVDCQYQHLARTGKDGNLSCTQVYAGWRRSWTLNTTSTRKHGRLAKQESKVKEMFLSPKLAASHNVADIYTVSDIWHLALFRPQPSQVSKTVSVQGLLTCSGVFAMARTIPDT